MHFLCHSLSVFSPTYNYHVCLCITFEICLRDHKNAIAELRKLRELRMVIKINLDEMFFSYRCAILNRHLNSGLESHITSSHIYIAMPLNAAAHKTKWISVKSNWERKKDEKFFCIFLIHNAGLKRVVMGIVR